jgi:glycine dehydrogenase subunit 1
VVTEPVALGLIKSPGEMGADIVVGEGQSLGVGLQFGGPYVGLFACREKHVRQMPGRLAGMTSDAREARLRADAFDPRAAYPAREGDVEHLHQFRLCALAFTIHMTLLGETGLRKLAGTNHAAAARVARRLGQVNGVELVNGNYFNEFTLKLAKPSRQVVRDMANKGVLGGVSLGRLYPGESELENGLLIAVTETVQTDDETALVTALEEALA